MIQLLFKWFSRKNVAKCSLILMHMHCLQSVWCEWFVTFETHMTEMRCAFAYLLGWEILWITHDSNCLYGKEWSWNLKSIPFLNTFSNLILLCQLNSIWKREVLQKHVGKQINRSFLGFEKYCSLLRSRNILVYSVYCSCMYHVIRVVYLWWKNVLHVQAGFFHYFNRKL